MKNDERKENCKFLVISNNGLLIDYMTDYVKRLDNESIDIIVEKNIMSATNILGKDESIQAVYLDFEGQYCDGNALVFLSRYHNIRFQDKPYLIILTDDKQNRTLDVAMQLGADLIVSKELSIELIEVVRMLDAFVQKQSQPLVKEPLSEEDKKKKTRRIISKELNKLHMNPKHIGYQYLIEAICLTIEAPGPNVTKRMELLEGKSSASIERAMQNAICRTWERTPKDILSQRYTAALSKGKKSPTTTELIYYYYNNIRNSDWLE